MSSPSKNIFWLSVSRIAALSLLFLAYTQLFRYLGPHTSGQYQFVLSYATIFGIIIDFGIQQYIVKKISEEPHYAKKYFQNFLAIEVLLVIGIYSAMLAVAYFNHYETVVLQTIIVSGLGTVLIGLTYPFLAVMTAFSDLKKVALINFINSCVNVGIIFLTIALHKSIIFLASSQIIFGLIDLILYYKFAGKYIARVNLFKIVASIDKKLIKRMFGAALPFALLVGFSTIYNRIDVIIIKHLLGYTETGLYTAAYKVFDLLAFFPAVVSHSLYPIFAGLAARQAVTDIRTHLEKYLRFLVALALPLAVGGSLLAQPIIRLVAGPEFIDAAPVLAILTWASAVLFIYIIANALVISELTKFAVWVTGSNVLINILGNLFLIPHIGIKGAAIMTLISECVQGTFYFYFVKTKVTNFHIMPMVWKPALAATAMGLFLWNFPRLSLVPALISGGLCYGLSLLIMGFFNKNDLRLIKRFTLGL